MCVCLVVVVVVVGCMRVRVCVCVCVRLTVGQVDYDQLCTQSVCARACCSATVLYDQSHSWTRHEYT